MTGMCRHTGKPLAGWDHIRQSLDVIFTTRLRTRLQRREFGSIVPDLQDKPTNPELLLDAYVAIAEAITTFEPRVILNGFRLVSADQNGDALIMTDLTEIASGSVQGYEVLL